MSYHGYVPLLKKFLYERPEPAILEVGVDRGVTMFPLVTFLAQHCRTAYVYMGVDIDIQESVRLTLMNMEQPIPTSTWLFEKNSLDFLPKVVDSGRKLDLILLDGDHNYHTVSKELEYVLPLLKEDGILMIDDYGGKWADRDLWYSERPGYESNALATKPASSEKHGVRPAVDEWLERNPGLKRYSLLQGEPLLVTRIDMHFAVGPASVPT